MNKAIWLGFFFFVALVLLLFAALWMDKGIRFTKPPKLKFNFNRVEGLREGDDIRVDGLRIGKVHKIELREPGIRVEGHIETEVKLYRDYAVFVESFTLLGGNFISISRGDPRTGDLPKDTVLVGAAKPSALDTVGKVLSENSNLITDMLTSIKGAGEELKGLVQDIRTGQGTLPRLINDPKIFDSMVKAMDEFRMLMEKANNGTGTLGKLINDPTLYDSLTASLTDIRGTAASAKGLFDKINSGQGAIGKLMTDAKVAEDLEKLMSNLRAASDDLRGIMDKITKGEGTLGKLVQDDSLYDRGKAVLDSADTVLGRVGRARVFIGADGAVYADNEYSTAKMYLRIWPDDTKYFQAGVTFLGFSATGPTIRFEEQLERGEDDTIAKGEIFAMYKVPWFFDNHVGVRLGLLEGKPGGGVDINFRWGNWPLLAQFDIRDAYGSVEDEDIDENVRGPMTRASLRFPLWSPGGDSWWKQVLFATKVQAGMSRLQDDPEFFIGGGIEFEDQDIRTLIGIMGLSR
jgi:phospholipid/cholesterol/gamma-HCH transport system substrate-binding protein